MTTDDFRPRSATDRTPGPTDRRSSPWPARLRRRWLRRTVAALAAVLWVPLAAGCGSDGERVGVTLLSTTDVHGYLLPWSYSDARSTDSSLVQLATVVDSVRDADPHVVLVDSGDFLQGSELTDYVAATGIDSVHPIVAAMNELDYDAAAIGNHEYNHGISFLEEALSGGEFPFLSANVYHADTDSLVYSPFTVVERGPIRVGVLGLTTPGIAVWDRDHVEGRFRFEDMIASAERWLPAMEEHDPDVVVVAAHSGIDPGSTYGEDATGARQEAVVGELAREVDGIDVVFAGHTSGPVAPREIGGALVTHAGHWGETLAAIEVTMERAGSGEWEVAGKDGSLLEARGHRPDPRLERVVRPAHEATQAWLDETLAHTPDRWTAEEARVRDTPIADLITTAMMEPTGADVASTAIFDPSVGFGPGPITRRDVLALYRYPNRLKSVRVSGREIRSYLERSARYYHQFPSEELVSDSVIAFNYDVLDGIEYRLDLARPIGERVTDLRHEGEPVTDADTLLLAVNSYRQSGGGGFEMLVEAPVEYSGDEVVSEVIADFIRRRDTLRVGDVFRENWELEPEEAVRQLIESEATLPRF